MMIRNYSELSLLPSLEERYRYLKLDGVVGQETFGFDRILNQRFYKSEVWKNIRDFVIIRDLGCDLGIEGNEIYGRILIHHMNPITTEDILSHSDFLLNPEYLVCTNQRTHNAIHYGDEEQAILTIPTRRKNDTSPWRK